MADDVDYRERTFVTKEWRRSNRVTILNPYLGIPQILYDEEDMRDAAGDVKATPAGSVSTSYAPEKTIAMVDPGTLQPTGETVTMGAAYLILFSLYLQLARERDAAE